MAWWPDRGLEGLRIVGIALEAHQLAEGFFDDRLFDDRDVPAVGAYRFDIEFGFFVFLAESVQQLVAGSQSRGAGHQGHRAQGIGKGLGRSLRPCGKRVQHRALEFMQLVKHDVVPIRLGAKLEFNAWTIQIQQTQLLMCY